MKFRPLAFDYHAEATRLLVDQQRESPPTIWVLPPSSDDEESDHDAPNSASADDSCSLSSAKDPVASTTMMSSEDVDFPSPSDVKQAKSPSRSTFSVLSQQPEMEEAYEIEQCEVKHDDVACLPPPDSPSTTDTSGMEIEEHEPAPESSMKTPLPKLGVVVVTNTKAAPNVRDDDEHSDAELSSEDEGPVGTPQTLSKKNDAEEDFMEVDAVCGNDATESIAQQDLMQMKSGVVADIGHQRPANKADYDTGMPQRVLQVSADAPSTALVLYKPRQWSLSNTLPQSHATTSSASSSNLLDLNQYNNHLNKSMLGQSVSNPVMCIDASTAPEDDPIVVSSSPPKPSITGVSYRLPSFMQSTLGAFVRPRSDPMQRLDTLAVSGIKTARLDFASLKAGRFGSVVKTNPSQDQNSMQQQPLDVSDVEPGVILPYSGGRCLIPNEMQGAFQAAVFAAAAALQMNQQSMQQGPVPSVVTGSRVEQLTCAETESRLSIESLKEAQATGARGTATEGSNSNRKDSNTILEQSKPRPTVTHTKTMARGLTEQPSLPSKASPPRSSHTGSDPERSNKSSVIDTTTIASRAKRKHHPTIEAEISRGTPRSGDAGDDARKKLKHTRTGQRADEGAHENTQRAIHNMRHGSPVSGSAEGLVNENYSSSPSDQTHQPKTAHDDRELGDRKSPECINTNAGVTDLSRSPSIFEVLARQNSVAHQEGTASRVLQESPGGSRETGSGASPLDSRNHKHDGKGRRSQSSTDASSNPVASVRTPTPPRELGRIAGQAQVPGTVSQCDDIQHNVEPRHWKETHRVHQRRESDNHRDNEARDNRPNVPDKAARKEEKKKRKRERKEMKKAEKARKRELKRQRRNSFASTTAVKEEPLEEDEVVCVGVRQNPAAEGPTGTISAAASAPAIPKGTMSAHGHERSSFRSRPSATTVEGQKLAALSPDRPDYPRQREKLNTTEVTNKERRLPSERTPNEQPRFPAASFASKPHPGGVAPVPVWQKTIEPMGSSPTNPALADARGGNNTIQTVTTVPHLQAQPRDIFENPARVDARAARLAAPQIPAPPKIRSQFASMLPFEVLCSEKLIESYGETIADLATGRWAATLFRGAHRMLDNPVPDTAVYGRKIVFQDSRIVDGLGVDVELPGGNAIIVQALPLTRDFIKRVIRVGASGRYLTMTCILCQGKETNDAASPQRVLELVNSITGDFSSSPVQIQVTSTASLSCCLAQSILKHVAEGDHAGYQGALRLLGNENVLYRVSFLVTLLPSLSVVAAVNCICITGVGQNKNAREQFQLLLRSQDERKRLGQIGNLKKAMAQLCCVLQVSLAPASVD